MSDRGLLTTPGLWRALTRKGLFLIAGPCVIENPRHPHAVAAKVKALTGELGIPYVFRLVNPVSRFRLTDRAYWGYSGMLNLIEVMQNEWWDRYRSKRRRYKARW